MCLSFLLQRCLQLQDHLRLVLKSRLPLDDVHLGPCECLLQLVLLSSQGCDGGVHELSLLPGLRLLESLGFDQGLLKICSFLVGSFQLAFVVPDGLLAELIFRLQLAHLVFLPAEVILKSHHLLLQLQHLLAFCIMILFEQIIYFFSDV